MIKWKVPFQYLGASVIKRLPYEQGGRKPGVPLYIYFTKAWCLGNVFFIKLLLPFC